MLVTFPPKNFTKGLEDREFLRSLDERLRYVTESIITPNMSGRPFKTYSDCYHDDQKLTESEIEKALSLVTLETRIAMTPTTTTFGFFTVYQFIYTFDKKSLLKFEESQVPKGYDFHTLGLTFNHPDNIAMLKSIGIEALK